MTAAPPAVYAWCCAACGVVTHCCDDGRVSLNKGKCDPFCSGRDLHIWKHMGTAASFEGPTRVEHAA